MKNISNGMKLSIIVLSFNTKNLTLKCLRSINRQYKDSIQRKEIELILVDNASSDGTVEEIQKLSIRQAQDKNQNYSSKVKIIQNKENYGFSKGNNMGAKKAMGEYLLFLNTDTEVKDQGFLKMAQFLSENKNVGVLGGKLLNPDGSNQKSAGNFYSLLNLFVVLLGGERLGMIRKSPASTQAVDWVSGACMMVRKSLFNKLSGFDENFFMYIEDMELCFRAKKAGYKTFFYPNLNLIHKELGSGNREFAVKHIYKGLLYFYKKHKPYWQYILVKILLLVKAVLAFSIGILSNNLYLKKTYGQALRLAI